jgi:hypothetical protein
MPDKAAPSHYGDFAVAAAATWATNPAAFPTGNTQERKFLWLKPVNTIRFLARTLGASVGSESPAPSHRCLTGAITGRLPGGSRLVGQVPLDEAPHGGGTRRRPARIPCDAVRQLVSPLPDPGHVRVVLGRIVRREGVYLLTARSNSGQKRSNSGQPRTAGQTAVEGQASGTCPRGQLAGARE